MKITYPACFYPEENGTFSVEIPDLCCATQGKDLTEAIKMAADAATGWILDALSHGEPIPTASKIEAIMPNNGGFISEVTIDLANLDENICFGQNPSTEDNDQNSNAEENPV